MLAIITWISNGIVEIIARSNPRINNFDSKEFLIISQSISKIKLLFQIDDLQIIFKNTGNKRILITEG